MSEKHSTTAEIDSVTTLGGKYWILIEQTGQLFFAAVFSQNRGFQLNTCFFFSFQIIELCQTQKYLTDKMFFERGTAFVN